MVKIKESDNQTRDRIFKAASDIFEEKGYDGARMQEIGRPRWYRTKRCCIITSGQKNSSLRRCSRCFSGRCSRDNFHLHGRYLIQGQIRKFFDQHIEILIKNPKLPIFLLNEISHNPDLVEGIHETLPYGQLRSVISRNMQGAERLRNKKDDMPQLMMTVVSLSVFPFAARDVIKMMIPEVGDNKKFVAFMRERKEFAADFVITALKNRKK